MEKVLIIEDNAMMRLFLTNYLSHAYEVVTAQSPQEGMAVLDGKAHEFSLVLADYYAPGTSEMKILGNIKHSLGWQNIPMIILTDEDKSAQRIAAFELGASDCLSKPFNPAELAMRMKGLMSVVERPAVYRPVA